MLQNIRDNLTGPIMWIVIGIIVVPFALFGIETFRTGGGDPTVAKVGDQKITQSQFRAAYDQRLQQLQQLMGEHFRADQFDQKRFQQQVLEDMVQEQLMRQSVRDAGYRASDAAVYEMVSNIPAFHENGRFSTEAYRQRLQQQGYSTARFESQLRDSIVVDQLREGVLASAFVPEVLEAPDYRLAQQQRALTYVTFESSRYLPSVQIDAAKVQERYDAQKSRYQAPERVRVSYLELALDAMPAAEKPSAEFLRGIYEADKAAKFSTPEERRARHILVRFGVDKAAAKQKIEKIAERLQKGGDFAKTAEAESEDPGSRVKGGDLGWIRHGQMVEKFEKPLFTLQKGELSEPVETEFGWHLIRVEEVREARTSPFEDAGVQSELLRIYRQKDAEHRFKELSEKLEQVAFESPNSLEPAAKAIGATAQTSEWFTRAGGAGITSNKAVIDAAFSEDVLKGGENSRVLTLGPNHVVVLRLQEHEAPRQKSLDEVQGAIRDELRLEGARERAAADAVAVLAAVNEGRSLQQAAGERGLSVKNAGLVKRQGSDVDPRIVDALFALPRPEEGRARWSQARLANGDLAVVGTTQVVDGDWATATEAERQAEVAREREATAGAEFAAYRADLQKRVTVKIIAVPEEAAN